MASRMTDYRNNVVPLFEDQPLDVGPASNCPACNATLATPIKNKKGLVFHVGSHAVFCGPTQRLQIGWFRKCKTPGQHLHQTCWHCGAKWIRNCTGIVHT